jgi:hypothetical protein
MSKNSIDWEEESAQSQLHDHRQTDKKPLVKTEVLDFDLDLGESSQIVVSECAESSQIVVSNMAESSKSCEVGEANKLAGIQNYNVWKIKMEAILRRERLWGLVETNRSIAVFPAEIDGVFYPNEEKLRSAKQRARFGLILSVADNLLGIVAGKPDLADSWDLLRRMYNACDQQQILYLTNKLHSMILKEGGDVTTYLMEGSNLRNHLMTLGETISDKQLINIVLNGLPRSYDMVVQGISYFQNPTYEDVMGKILAEAQRLLAREQKLGQGEALAVQGPYHFGQTRGGRSGRRGFACPNFNIFGYPRPYGYPPFQIRSPSPGQFRN